VSAAEVVIFIAFIAAIGLGSLRLIAAGNRSRALNPRSGHWTTAVHARATGGYQVVVERQGEPRQVVREIPPGLEGAELSTAMADAQADADEHAAALNAVRA
jgi:hypothetical protein